jgi:hypothetical protein
MSESNAIIDALIPDAASLVPDPPVPDWVKTGKVPQSVVEAVVPPKKRKRSATVAQVEALRAELEVAKTDASYWRSLAERGATISEMKDAIFSVLRESCVVEAIPVPWWKRGVYVIKGAPIPMWQWAIVSIIGGVGGAIMVNFLR